MPSVGVLPEDPILRANFCLHQGLQVGQVYFDSFK